MVSNFYIEDGPMPFRGTYEEEPEVPGKKRRKVIFNAGLPGPMGYPGGSMMYPFVMGPVLGYEEEDEDPNP